MADISWHFKGKDFFWQLPLEKREFIAVSIYHKARKNQLLFLEGDNGNSVFYLAEGKVRIFRSSACGKETILFIRQPGEMFGLAEFMGKHERVFNAQAMTACRLYEMRGPEFEVLLRRHFTLAQRVIEELGRRLRYLGEQMDSLMISDVSTRLLKLLMCISCHNMIDQGEMNKPIPVSLKLTQEQIAAMIGSTQQTVSETLKKLKEDGMIDVAGKEITLLEPRKIFKLILP